MVKGDKKKKRKYSEEQINFVVELVGVKKMDVTPATRLMCEHFSIEFDDSIGRLFRKKMQDMGVTHNTTRIEDHEMFQEAINRVFDKNKKRFIITWAQSYSEIHNKFWDNIKAYAEYIDAGIHVIAGRYKNPTNLKSNTDIKKTEKNDSPWSPLLKGYLDANRQNIHELLTVCGDVKVQPTASTPLSGFNGLTGLESCIIGHPRVHMDACPVLEGYPNKTLYTTGSVTLPDYTDTKAGKKGEFNHQYGFVIVELDGKDVHVRQIQADDNGSFYDLIHYVENRNVNIVNNSASAIVFGDMHIGQHDKKAVNLSFKMARKLGAKKIVLHDIFDSHSISHHELDDPFIQLNREKDGTNSLELEMKRVTKFLRKYEDEFNFITVRSNHDEFVDRWLKSNDWRKNVNRESYLKLASIKAKGKAPKGILPYYLEKKVKNLIGLGINESYPINGYECAIHGHKGSNGSRGSHIQFKNLNVKNITGHTHTPRRYDGHLSVGTLTHKRLDYTEGPSTWNQANVVIYPNGKASHIIISPKYRYTTLF